MSAELYFFILLKEEEREAKLLAHIDIATHLPPNKTLEQKQNQTKPSQNQQKFFYFLFFKAHKLYIVAFIYIFARDSVCVCVCLKNMGHHSCCNQQKVKRGLWSPEEDEKLIRYINTHGYGCWSEVPEKAGHFFFLSFHFSLAISHSHKHTQQSHKDMHQLICI